MPEFTEVTFECVVHVQKTEIMQIYSRKCCVLAGSQIDPNQGAICKNVLCTAESMAESIDHAPAKPSPAKRRHFQTFKKVHHEKWPFVTIDEKGDTCVNSEVHSTVLKLFDCGTVKRDRQKTAFSSAWNL